MPDNQNRPRPRVTRRPSVGSGSGRAQSNNTAPRYSASNGRNNSSNASYGRVRRASKSVSSGTTGVKLQVRGGRDVAEIKREQRQIVEAKREREWQSEVERVRGGIDKIMLVIIVLLLALGALMVYSASYPTALGESGNSFTYLRKHILYMCIGGVLMFFASIIPYTWFKKWGAFAAYGVAVIMLLAVLVMGTSEGEAKRWIYIGSFSIQPSEIMKVALVLILAWYIDKYQHKFKERNGFLQTYKVNTLFPVLFVGFACILVLLEKHLSGTVIIGFIGVAVMLVGGCHLWYTLGTALAGGAVAILGFLAVNPYALKRITTFTSENADKLGEAWQTTQGILAIGSGGPFGVGFSESRQKFSYVSMAHNDFIFSIWCEELGFVGAVLLIALFIAFIWRGYVIAMRAPDTFSMLTVFGITTQVGLQAFLNMMVVCNILPNTGISLPFFSYGGSSLIMLMAEMGLILSISRQYYRKKV